MCRDYNKRHRCSADCDDVTVTTKLDQLLDSIDPTRTYEKVAKRVDIAFNMFRIPDADIRQWDDFERCMVAFFRHTENTVLQASPNFVGDHTMDWHFCLRILCDIYGKNGEKAAFEMARTGNEGGLYAVLKTVAERMAEKYTQSEVQARVSHYWLELTTDEKLFVAEEYLKKWGHLLPSELTEGSAARLKMNFPRVLEKHSQLLARTRKVGR